MPWLVGCAADFCGINQLHLPEFLFSNFSFLYKIEKFYFRSSTNQYTYTAFANTRMSYIWNAGLAPRKGPGGMSVGGGGKPSRPSSNRGQSTPYFSDNKRSEVNELR